ncbi:MAG: glycosyltransferase family 2 protein [Erysipelotrichaceae bacterium]|nr:glycosyltransferase family 2 protein [Erysipelotrichaceae bacterium]
METVKTMNLLIGIVFAAVYAYQFLYVPLSLLGKEKRKDVPLKEHRYAVLICARNEEKVIGDLLDSLAAQDYPRELLDCYVMADNCTDATASVAEAHGACVFERFDAVKRGKGYALDTLLKAVRQKVPGKYTGYFVFDADNLLAADYIRQMNRRVCEGCELITSYRNSKNYSHNWISAASALWFLRESRYLNYPRHLCGSSGAVSGTGFYFSETVAAENDGWPYHLLTEDVEFSADQILKGRKVAFCKEAVLYDEQPVTLTDSFRQRLRWSKGFFQVFHRYGKELAAASLKGSFACYDLLNTIMPAFVLSVVSLLLNGICLFASLKNTAVLRTVLQSQGMAVAGAYLTLFLCGLITTVSEWRKICAPAYKKILYLFSFPVFMMMYLPISVLALFTAVRWDPIPHSFTAGQFRRELRENGR